MNERYLGHLGPRHYAAKKVRERSKSCAVEKHQKVQLFIQNLALKFDSVLTDAGYQNDAKPMALLANLIKAKRIPANQRAS